jgi:hypothetical protein
MRISLSPPGRTHEMVRLMSQHRFRLGQKVQFSRGYPYRSASGGFYEIVRHLPGLDGELYYRIKSSREPHERVVKESEIQKI